MVTEAVDRLRLVAPVDIMVVAGNHDRDRMFYLGDALESHYRNCANVNVDNAPSVRKYYRYGKCLLGYTHGHTRGDSMPKDLPRLMAEERPQDWAETTWREWHLGHLHRKREFSWLSVDTLGEVIVRHLPSLSAVDAWAFGEGYVPPRIGEAYLYDRRDGFRGYFSTSARRAR